MSNHAKPYGQEPYMLPTKLVALMAYSLNELGLLTVLYLYRQKFAMRRLVASSIAGGLPSLPTSLSLVGSPNRRTICFLLRKDDLHTIIRTASHLGTTTTALMHAILR